MKVVSLVNLQKWEERFKVEMMKISNGMNQYVIKGGRKLRGTVVINSSKNVAMGILAASLINEGKTIIKNAPRIEELFRIVEVMESIGVQIKWRGKKELEIKPPKKFNLDKINIESAAKTRSIILFVGALVHKFQNFSLPDPGGCKLGKRTIMPHIYALENFGIKVKTLAKGYKISYSHLRPAENIVKKNISYYILEDPIESMLFLAAAIVTKSSIIIKRCPIDFLELELLKLKKMGFRFKILKEYKAKNGLNRLADIKTFPSNLKAPVEKIYSRPFPGLNIDNLPFFVPIVTQAKGESLIHDWAYENRAIYYTEIGRMGAKIKLADPHRVFIEGPTSLTGAEISCPPALRPSAILFVAMLAAKGRSVLKNIYNIERGYEDLVGRFNKLGAQVKKV